MSAGRFCDLVFELENNMSLVLFEFKTSFKSKKLGWTILKANYSWERARSDVGAEVYNIVSSA